MNYPDLLGVTGRRQDGRYPSELRKISCRMGSVVNADGSAYFQMGLSRVLAVVKGPIASHKRYDLPSACESVRISVTILGNASSGQKSGASQVEVELGSTLTKCFDTLVSRFAYPDSTIHVHCSVIQRDGSVLSVCVNAVWLALVDAGVCMNDFAIGLCVGYMDKMLLSDLSEAEYRRASLIMNIIYQPMNEKVLLLTVDHSIQNELFDSLMSQMKECCIQLYFRLRECLNDYVSIHKEQCVYDDLNDERRHGLEEYPDETFEENVEGMESSPQYVDQPSLEEGDHQLNQDGIPLDDYLDDDGDVFYNDDDDDDYNDERKNGMMMTDSQIKQVMGALGDADDGRCVHS